MVYDVILMKLAVLDSVMLKTEELLRVALTGVGLFKDATQMTENREISFQENAF